MATQHLQNTSSKARSNNQIVAIFVKKMIHHYHFRGEAMEYWCTGDTAKPPLVLVHGAFYHDIWYGVREALAAEYAVYEVVLAGFGNSAVIPDETHDIGLWGAQLEYFLEEVLAERSQSIHAMAASTHLAGFSYGAAIALQTAQDYQFQRVSRLGLPVDAYSDAASAFGKLPRWLLRAFVSQEWFRRQFVLPVLQDSIADDIERERLGDSFLTAMRKTSTAALADPDYLRTIREVPTLLAARDEPTRLIYGAHDPLLNPGRVSALSRLEISAEEHASSTPILDLHVIPDVGHNAMFGPEFLQHFLSE